MKVVENPFVVVMFGYPATGKTYTSRALQKYCSQLNPTSLLTTFTIREELGLVDLHSDEQRKKVYREMMSRANSLMEASSSHAILDGNFNKYTNRKAIYDLAVQHGYEVFVVHCDVTNHAVIEERLERRKNMPKSIEHAASTMDLYHLIKNTADPLEVDLQNKSLINIIKVNSELQTVAVEHLTETGSYNLKDILNGVQYDFRKVPK